MGGAGHRAFRIVTGSGCVVLSALMFLGALD